MIWLPTGKTGFKEVIGSWKIMEIRFPRICRIWDPEDSIKFLSSKRISPSTIFPGGLGKSRKIDKAVIVFPHPLSPTIPRVSLGRRSKLTPSTARIKAFRVKKYVLSERMESRGFCSFKVYRTSRILGSKASLSPSPRRLRAKHVKTMANPGNRVIQKASLIKSRPELIIFPQLGISGETPHPRKLKDA
jgi:hypothetical protein